MQPMYKQVSDFDQGPSLATSRADLPINMHAFARDHACRCRR
jgi:hypothetical protein